MAVGIECHAAQKAMERQVRCLANAVAFREALRLCVGRWDILNGATILADVIEGAEFVDGEKKCAA